MNMNLTKSKYWIVVTNASKLRIFAIDHDLHKIVYDLVFVEELNHNASRLRDSELDGDRPGRYKINSSNNGSAYEYKTDSTEREKIHFATEIALFLRNAKDCGKFEKLIIIAHDHFYGILKQHFDHIVQDSIYNIILKDYTLFTKEDLAKMIRNEITNY